MKEWDVREKSLMHKIDDDKKYVTFSLSLLRNPPSFKNVVPRINATKDMPP
jgi:hypothetical protein